MRAGWSRGLVALLLATGAGTLGAAALLASPAYGVQSVTKPTITIAPQMGSDGSVTVTYTDPVGGLENVNPNSLSLTFTWDPPAQIPNGAPQPNPTTFTENQSDASCSGSGPIICTYPFPSALMVQSYALNGMYQLTAAGQDCLGAGLGVGCESGSSMQTDGLDAPPSPPTKVTAVAGPNGAPPVTVTWTPSPQPDIAGYRVFRNGQYACSVPAVPTPNSWSCADTNSGGGTFTYTVVAYRYGATYASNALVASSAASAPAATKVSGPPTTTTVPRSTTTLPPLQPVGFKPVTQPGRSASSGGTGLRSLSPTPAGAASAATTTPVTVGGGYNPTLPYGASPQSSTTVDPAAISVPAPPHKGSSVGTFALIGAGLLIAVIAGHGLWLRSEVRRAGALEPLEPDR